MVLKIMSRNIERLFSYLVVVVRIDVVTELTSTVFLVLEECSTPKVFIVNILDLFDCRYAKR